MTRRYLHTALFLLIPVLLAAAGKPVYFFTSFHEPATAGLRMLYSYDARHWTDLDTVLLKPEVGQQKVMRDPSIAQGPDGTFHLVWTSSWRGDRGFGHASSKDLVHWSEQTFVPVMDYDTSTVNVWAPEVFYDAFSRKFYIVWASTVPFRFAKGQEDELNNHRLYYTSTTDFKSFSKARLFFDPGYSVIDGVVRCRGKNDYVLVFKDNTRPERDIKVAFGRSPVGPWTRVSKALTGFCTEGPTAVKAGNDWLIYFDAYREKRYPALRTSDFKTFADASSEVSVPEGHKHGTIVVSDEGTLQKLLLATDPARLPHYSGTTLSNVDYHHGMLAPAVGVHSRQVMRASREHPELADGFGFTYNHAPMMAYWNQTFFVHYLSDPTGEHIPPGQTLLVTSSDQGRSWSKPRLLFPPYKVPDGYRKPGVDTAAHGLLAVMHQRVGFYVSKSGRLLCMGFYGVAMDAKDDPNDGNGIGRVVREIYADGSFGPIHFLRYNHGFDESNTDCPFFTRNRDKGFVQACREILDNPLYMMQTVEEADRNDPLIPLNKEYKAFCWYHLPDGNIAAFWKHALTSVSTDGGRTWKEPVLRAHGFVNSNAKIWAQRTSDGRYAAVYNPSEFRWPLALSTSQDGLDYTDLLLVHGEISPMRYGGNYKSYGPQYVRGIQEGNGTPPDGQMWVTYSMNKEDIWVASVPVPVRSSVRDYPAEVFDSLPQGHELDGWNTCSPAWAPVGIERLDGVKCLSLRDKDPFDLARAERIIPASTRFRTRFTLQAGQTDQPLDIEFCNAQGLPSIRLSLMPDGNLYVKAGARPNRVMAYEKGKDYRFEVRVNTDIRTYEVWVDGKKIRTNLFYRPAAELSRVVFRTGPPRSFPTPETPADNFTDLPGTGAIGPEAAFFLKSFDAQIIAP